MPVYYQNFKKFLFFFNSSVLYCSDFIEKENSPLFKISWECIKM